MTDEFDPFEIDGPGEDDGLAKVDLEFATLRDFREQMAPFLGDRGFFARSERPLPRDTPVHFRFVLPEGFALAEGTAVVAWNIEPESHPDLIPGMALRFVDVGKQSRSVIRELVDFHVATGGDPFDLGPAAADPGEIPTDSLDSGQPEPDPEFDFQPVEAQADGGEPQTAERRDEVLPDWLSEATDPEHFNFGSTVDRHDDEEASPGDPVVAEAGESADFDVDVIFDDNEVDAAPRHPPVESVRDAIDMPRSAHAPPRDLRLGLIVAAGLAVVAVAILVWSLWLRPGRPETSQTEEAPVEAVAPGIEIVSDQAEAPAEEGPTKVFVAEQEPQEPLPVEPEAPAVERPATRQTAPRQSAESPVLSAPANRIVDVAAATRKDVTTVIIRGNGVIAKRAVRISRLEDPVRIWVQISNIETFYKPNEIPVGSPEVLQVRVGYHPEETPPALWVVIDLADPMMVLKESDVTGDSIRLSVGRK